MKLWGYMFLLLGSILLAACNVTARADDDLSQRRIRVVATTGMITDVVKHVGGERVEVTGLMGAGVDPHLYKASENDVLKFDQADIIFYNGLHLEAGMASVFERISEYRRVVAVTDNIDRQKLLAPPEFEDAYDPHIWFDVAQWMTTVGIVRDTLVEMDPTNAVLYEQNAASYLEQLDTLHHYVQEQAERVPLQQRVLITAHDAFNYFGRAYGFDVRGLQGISTATEASTGDVAALAELIVDRQIPAIFIETSVPQRNVQAVQAAVKARGFDLVIGGELFSDAMGNPGTEEGTYIGMVRHNIDTIVGALLDE